MDGTTITRGCHRPRTGFRPERWLAEPRQITPRLPDDRTQRDTVDRVLADLIERDDRLVDPDLARMIYAEVEYLTRTSGVLAVTSQQLADRVNLAVARRNVIRARTRGVRPVPKATVGKVRAVLHRLSELGWLTPERKTMRARVWVVSHGHTPGSARAQESTANTGSSPDGEPVVIEKENATWLDAHDDLDGDDDGFWTSATGTPVTVQAPCVPEQTRPTREQVAAVCALVDKHRDRLACRGVSNPAGAWYRWLIARVRYHQGGALAVSIARYDRAMDALAGESRDGRIWLSTRRVTRHCR